jgi:hypothetical protein
MNGHYFEGDLSGFRARPSSFAIHISISVSRIPPDYILDGHRAMTSVSACRYSEKTQADKRREENNRDPFALRKFALTNRLLEKISRLFDWMMAITTISHVRVKVRPNQQSCV